MSHYYEWKEIKARPRVGYTGEIRRWRASHGRGRRIAEIAELKTGCYMWDLPGNNHGVWRRAADTLELAQAGAEYALRIPQQFHAIATSEWQDMQYGFAIRKFGLFKPYLIVTGFGQEGDGNWYLYPLGKNT